MADKAKSFIYSSVRFQKDLSENGNQWKDRMRQLPRLRLEASGDLDPAKVQEVQVVEVLHHHHHQHDHDQVQGGAVLWQGLPAGALGEGAQAALQAPCQSSRLESPLSPPISIGGAAWGQLRGAGFANSATSGEDAQGQERGLHLLLPRIEPPGGGDGCQQERDLVHQEGLACRADQA